jgi:GcrA cell cycle regulator
MAWTNELIHELTQLWDAGYSASHIGKRLGVSKNAVIGKAHRLKLPARPSPIRAERAVPRLRPPAPKAVLNPRPALEVVPKPAPKPAFRPARRHAGGPSCLWPIGDPGQPDFHFCGEPSMPGKPYCDSHCARAYVTKSRAGSEAA